MAAGVVRVLLIYFIFLAYSDDFLLYGSTHSGCNQFCFEDIHGCFSDGFLPRNFGCQFSLVGSHVVIRRRELSSLEVLQPCSKHAKHGSTCLVCEVLSALITEPKKATTSTWRTRSQATTTHLTLAYARLIRAQSLGDTKYTTSPPS